MNLQRIVSLLFLCYTTAFIHKIEAQKSKVLPKDTAKKESAKDTTKKETLADKIKGSTKTQGLFVLYQDTVSGSLNMYIGKNQLKKEYLYQSFSMGGPPELFLNQNMIRETWLFTIRKNFDKLYWVRSNTNYYFDKNHPISKAANVDVSESIFHFEKIISEDSLGYLINVDNLFLGEKLDPIKPFVPPMVPASAYLNLGTLNKDKSEYLKLRSFPSNTDIIVNLSYENPNPQYWGGPDITDPRFINVRMQHSFVDLPVNDFRPRADHPQVGYFTVQSENMTSTESIRYLDFINRWYLKKKNPELEISEPIEPIVWWVENTTPKEVRQIIIDAGNQWNVAFEKAGYKNAVVMKMMPDDADWDPADIRYNVIRWVASDLGFAIGPSFVNPRTGQILGADITIDFNFLVNTKVETELFEQAHQIENQFEKHDPRQCKLGKGLRLENQFAKTLLELSDADEAEKKELQRQFITELVLHEMGHTLGLNHNMKSSHMLSPDQLKNKEITGKFGVTGSVMDYSTVNLSLDKSKQAHYYTTVAGPYDQWAIEYGYREFKASEESTGLARIMNRSTESQLIFGNDADICGPGGGIDPRVMVWDMSNDPVSYAEERFAIIETGMSKLKSKFIVTGQSYEKYNDMYYTLFFQRFGMARSVANYVGGIYVDRSFPGQNSKNKPYTPVSEENQRRAIQLLGKYIFSNAAFGLEKEHYNYLQRQRRGFNFFGNSEDPKIDAIVTSAYNTVLNPILSSSTLRRMNNSSLYGNEYSTSELIYDLNKSIFEEDIKSNVGLFRKSLQQIYIERLINIYENKTMNYGIETKSVIYDALHQIYNKLAKNSNGDDATKAHRRLMSHQIAQSLKIVK